MWSKSVPAVFLVSAVVLSSLAVAQREFRLPLDLIPSHYDIQILVKPTPEDDFSFEGTVQINFTCVEATDTIILHNWELVVDEDNVLLQDDSGSPIGIVSHDYEWSFAEFHTMVLEAPLAVDGAYTITIPYTGKMVTYSAGLWYGGYNGDNGQEYFVATQMEPTSARAAFPSFDEPGLKATFDISIGHPVGTVAISNMPVKASAADPDQPNYVWEVYERTPPMPTYLVATVVGEYSRVETSDPRQFIAVRDEVTDSTGQAVEFAPAILAALEGRTGVDFPLPKLDHAGVIGFGGGMENYGLIIYDELGVADGGFASLTLMAHETAHMWTGDLVTCQWWDVTWLNEGMTHFFTYLVSGDVDTSFDYFDYLGTSLMESAMFYDVSERALPMVIPIDDPSDIGNAFNGALIYNRGGNIGRVMYYLLGEETLFAGLKNYFTDNTFKPVREEQLFGALGAAAEAAGLDLPDEFGNIMSPWTNQPGYPIVTVARLSTSGGETTLEVSQRRHLGVPLNDHDDDSVWPIGLTWSTAAEPTFDDTTPKEFLTGASTTVTVSAGDGDWVIFNNNRAGYYRVNYDREGWLLILEALGSGQVPEVNRAAIINDGSELCYYSLIDNDICFDLPKFLERETSLTVWMSAARSMHKFIARAADQKDATNRVMKMVEKAEFRTMRTREAMTPRRQNLLNFFKDYKQHLSGPAASSPYSSYYDRVWNKRFDDQSRALEARLGHRRTLQ